MMKNKTKFIFVLSIVYTILLTTSANAQDDIESSSSPISGGIFVNDSLGEQKDRWRTGGHQFSRRYFTEDLDRSLEIRMRTEIASPSNLENPDFANDRPYANVFALGAFQTFSQDELHYSFGGEVVATGKQTGLESLQQAFHDAIGIAGPKNVGDYKIGNNVYVSARVDARYDVQIGNNLRAIGYAEAATGFETYGRAGVDIVVSSDSFSYVSRDYITGTPVLTSQTRPKDAKYALIVGGDVSQFESSKLFPAWSNVELLESRTRLRGGILMETQSLRLFYGLASMSPEFDKQKGDQIVGMLSFGIDF